MLVAVLGRAVVVTLIVLGIYTAVRFLNNTSKTSTKKGKRNVR